MSSPQATFGVAGTIHSLSTTTYEAGTNKQGRAYQGGSYVDLTLIVEQAMLDGELTDIPATTVVRTDVATAKRYAKGQVVDFLVTPFVDLMSVRGRWVNRVGHRLAAEITGTPGTRAA